MSQDVPTAEVRASVLPYSTPEAEQAVPVHALTPADIIARILVWSVVCGVTALPSAIAAEGQLNILGMAAGVVFYVLLYAGVSCLPVLRRLYRDKLVRSTIILAYGARMVASLAFPVGMVLDAPPAKLALAVVKYFHPYPDDFFGTLALTLLQGFWLSMGTLGFVCLLYGIRYGLRAWRQSHGEPITSDDNA